MSVASNVIAGLNAPNTAPPSSAALGGQALDQRAFLRLLTTQMTTQDPFNPVDNTQMVAQMAQFSQVAGIAEMNQSLKTLIGSLGGGRRSDASSWIGRSMLVKRLKPIPVEAVVRGGAMAGLAEALTRPGLAIEVYKGLPASFRPWDRQLRQGVLLHTHTAVVALAPLENFLHQTNSLDTLGVDAPEFRCGG